MRLKFSKIFLCLIIILTGLLIFNPKPCKADETTDSNETATALSFTLNDSSEDTSLVTDSFYKTSVKYYANTSVNVKSEEDMYGIYIMWYHNPSQSYTISYEDTTIIGGSEGFLHEYIALDTPTKSLDINLTEDMRICEIEVFSKGELPSDVQVWNPSVDKADILVFSTHADDEILFLGGILACYGSRDDISVQVAYMCDFYLSEPYREHEELDGLWEVGLNIYPVKGNFYDYYCGDYDAALQIFNYDDVCAYTTQCIRRFQPLIVVTQDFNGEYGHGAHILLANAVADAVNNSNNANYHSESANEYGCYDVPKTYIHLYNEGSTITLDLRQELETLDNRTALDALKTAYKKHVSQQGWWFYVDDEYEYSPARFGLYRSLVGEDTGNDILENIKTYETIANEEKVGADEAALNKANDYSNSLVDSVKSIKEELKEYKTNSLPIKQLIVTLVAIFIIFFVILGQAKRHKKEYNKRLNKYKKENNIKD